jgi:hypothetical protein
MTAFTCYVPPTRTTVTTFPSVAMQEASEKRRKQLEAARARRKIINTRFYQKMQAQSQFTA